ncbi:MAG: MurR/RpiR family transcriptional regulator [Phyllobacterium sp.]
MSTSIAELITVKMGEMPASERKAAQTLMANYPLIGLRTVADFSAQAGVSSPTILRFVSRLGFQNYPEFQSALQEELAAQIQSPLIRNTIMKPPSGAVATLVASAIENITETFRHLPEKQVAEVIATLSRPRSRIFLIGGRFTDPIARYMAAHLRIIRSGVFHIDGQESIWRDQLIDMAKRDVLLVFDIRRYQDSLIRFAEQAQKRGAEIVLFTDQWISPISHFSRHVIVGRTAVPSAWDSTTALHLVVETLIAGLTGQMNQSGERIQLIERLRNG